MRFLLTCAFCISWSVASALTAHADQALPPETKLPPSFGENASRATSFADANWAQFYHDSVLQALIRTALGQNFDVQIAVQRIMQASEQVTATRANQLPALEAELAAPTLQVNGPLPPIFPHEDFAPSITGTVFYEVDLWGKLRSATAAGRAQLLASEDAREVVIVTLVSDVATAYFEMRALDEELDVLDRLLSDRKKSLTLTQDRYKQGQASQLDVDQAQSLVQDIEATVPTVQQKLKAAEITLSTLMGTYPQPVPRGLSLTQQISLPAIPEAGLPSALLERRPDIREAEQVLIAQHAQITVARAALFPQLNLTGSVGAGTYVVDGLFYGPHGLFALVPSLLYTIFNAGAQKAHMRAAEDAERQDLYSYLSTVHQSFAEVSTSLAGYHNFGIETVQLHALTKTDRESVDLASLRYYEGEGSYSDVLVAQERYLSASVDLVEGELDERLALVNLYAALGGGWQQ
ncbi:MAG: efflux transporter outer membrane subunit [Candidatus Eremiobacteraeota bacterium]|nr:efflux transporter outer membrane subunit [Candidatus Eremiobacteraeota bacterium]